MADLAPAYRDRIAKERLEAFRSALRGRVILPGDTEYERARRVYNACIDRRPALIVACASIADVIAAVRFGRENGLEMAIRSGGHNVAGFGSCEAGMVIDLSPMKGIRVDPGQQTVRVDGGCTWGDVDHATHVFGMATPGGVISTTGVAGLTLGGGIGHLTRNYGLSCDNLLSADVVTADGTMRVASSREEPDLFWAIRGGGGNFGVVTSFEFRLHPVNMIYGGPVLWPLERAGDALRLFRDTIMNAPEELSAFFAFLIVPPGPPFPEHLHNRTMAGVVCCYTGPLERGPEALRPFLRFGPPAFEHTGPMPFPVLQRAFDPLLPPGLYHYWKADFVNEIGDEMIDAHLRHGPSIPTFHSAVHIYPVNGAAHRVGKHDTAFSYRDANFVHVLAAVSREPEPLARYRGWVREYWSALHPYSAGGSYVNFLDDDEGPDRVAASYRDNHRRLTEVKARYDPENLFHVNQNIRPVALV